VGVLQRFERRLEGLVEGAFAKVFKGVVEPVEVAGALQREAADKKAIVGQGRVLVPNVYVVELGSSDHERLSPYSDALCSEFAAMVRENAQENGWAFVGPVRVHLELQEDLDTGMFRVRSGVVHDEPASGRGPSGRSAERPAPVASPLAKERDRRARLGISAYDSPSANSDAEATRAHRVGGVSSTPRLVVLGGDSDDGPEQVLEIDRDVVVVGRTGDVQLRLADPGVSRRHLELRRQGGDIVLSDLGSTNGTRVNGQQVDRRVLHDGDRIQLGESAMVFRRDPL
jgi:hypothetical protein